MKLSGSQGHSLLIISILRCALNTFQKNTGYSSYFDFQVVLPSLWQMST